MTTNAGTTSYNWSYDNRLIGINYPNATSNSYAYNAIGTRVSASGAGGSKTFRRDGVGVTAPLLNDGTNAITPGISTRESGVTKYSHGGLKNSTAQSNSSQTIAATKQFDAFGNQLSSSGSWTGAFGYGGAYGYQTDDELKLLGNRYYDSSIGRFLTRDPIKDGRNWYSYCENNPVSYQDSLGLWRRTVCAILGGIVGGILTLNPAGAMVGAAIGGGLGEAADQSDANEDGSVDLGQAAKAGFTDGIFGGGAGLAIKWMGAKSLPATLNAAGKMRGVHYTNPEAVAKIKILGQIVPAGKSGLGSLKGNVVYLWPKEVPAWVRGLFGLKGIPVEVWVEQERMRRTIFGFFIVKGNVGL